MAKEDAVETPETVETPEVRGTLLSNDDIAEWGNELRLVEKHEEEVAEETPKETPEETPEEVIIDEPIVEEEVPVDPGQFVANDYSFEVTYYDEEGKNGKTVKINSIDEWDNLLEKEPNFGTAAALLKYDRLANKMDSRTESDRIAWQNKVEEFNHQSQAMANRTESINTMMAEMNYLVNKGDLPPVAPEYQNADWSDTEVAKQPGVREQVEVLNYMQRENNARAKAGLKPITSVVDAYNAFMLDSTRKANVERRQQVAQDRKTAGARVAGTSPAPVSNTPKGIAVGRVGNLADMGTDWSV